MKLFFCFSISLFSCVCRLYKLGLDSGTAPQCPSVTLQLLPPSFPVAGRLYSQPLISVVVSVLLSSVYSLRRLIRVYDVLVSATLTVYCLPLRRYAASILGAQCSNLERYRYV